jgi:hypothetical protein
MKNAESVAKSLVKRFRSERWDDMQLRGEIVNAIGGTRPDVNAAPPMTGRAADGEQADAARPTRARKTSGVRKISGGVKKR